MYNILQPHTPEFLTGTPVSIQPQQGVIDMDPSQAQQLPQSISVELLVSCGPKECPVKCVDRLVDVRV